MDSCPDASIVHHFKDLKDPRIERAKKHRLIDILVIALGSIMVGGDGFQDMELFGQSKRAWLEGFLDLSNGIPSHDTFGRVFARLDPKQFHQCFLSWTQSVSALTQGTVVSLDGKTVKASFDRATALSPVHLVSAWCSQNGGLVMGQLKTQSKSNEITAIPELLKLLAVKGCIVTIDAMGCQAQIAKQIIDQEGDYLLALKRNQKKTYHAVTTHFHDQIEHNLSWRDNHNFFDTFDNSHGRTVRQRVWSLSDLSPIADLDKWEGLNSIVAVETIRQAHSQAEITSDYRFYLSSLSRSAQDFASLIRQHWDIENKLHWSLDVTFNEDHCRIRKDSAPENMAALRRLALNLLRQNRSKSISLRRKRLLCSLDEDYLLQTISGAT
jgi:predicted transposase YbfD/YdcC